MSNMTTRRENMVEVCERGKEKEKWWINRKRDEERYLP